MQALVTHKDEPNNTTVPIYIGLPDLYDLASNHVSCELFGFLTVGLLLLRAIYCGKPYHCLLAVLQDFDGVSISDGYDLAFKGVKEGWAD